MDLIITTTELHTLRTHFAHALRIIDKKLQEEQDGAKAPSSRKGKLTDEQIANIIVKRRSRIAPSK